MIDRLRARTAGLVVALAAAGLAAAPAAQAQDMLLGAALEDHLKSFKDAARSKDDREDAAEISKFYAARDHKSVWLTDGKPNARARLLIAEFALAGEHGLNPKAYGLPELKDKLDELAGKDPVALEMRLTRAYLRYASDVCCGRIQKPTKLGVFRAPRRPAATPLLEAAATSTDFKAHLASLEPDAIRYKRLKTALAEYRALKKKGGWKTVAAGPTLKPGMKNPRVAQVKARLLVTGELKSLGKDPMLYDKAWLPL